MFSFSTTYRVTLLMCVFPSLNCHKFSWRLKQTWITRLLLVSMLTCCIFSMLLCIYDCVFWYILVVYIFSMYFCIFSVYFCIFSVYFCIFFSILQFIPLYILVYSSIRLYIFQYTSVFSSIFPVYFCLFHCIFWYIFLP